MSLSTESPSWPGLGLPLELDLALSERLETLLAKGGVELPEVAGLSAFTLGRLLYQRQLQHEPQRQRRWFPLVELDPSAVSPSALASGQDMPLEDTHPGLRWVDEALTQAAGGWLTLGSGWSALGRIDGLTSRARRAGVKLLLAGRGQPVELSAEVRDRLQRLHELHDVGTDPALRPAREAIQITGTSGGLLHLRARPNVGATRLVRWVHLLLGQRAELCEVHPGRPASPGYTAWGVYEDFPVMDYKELERPAQRLPQPYQPLPRPPRGAPVELSAPLAALKERSPRLSLVLEEAQRIIHSRPQGVVIRGPTGVGKGVLVEAMAEAWGLKGRLVTVELGSLAPNLFEDELFGHVAGAFNDAKERIGLIRAADGGVLFLDEVDRLPLELQQKLLVVLERRCVRPIGSETEYPVDFQLVVACQLDLKALDDQGRFLPDLYYRLRFAELVLPALADREEDILPLAEWMLSEAFAKKRAREQGRDASKLSRAPVQLTEEAQRALLRWPWPGNARELAGAMSAAAARAPGRRIQKEHLGELADTEAGPGPVFLIGEVDEASLRDKTSLERHRLRELTAGYSVSVPTLRERPLASRRHLLLARLEGRPIETGALDRLAQEPQYGNLRALDALAAQLLRRITGPISLDALYRHASDLTQSTSQAPILVLMHPVRQPDGSVTGWTQSFDEEVVVVGRGDLDALRGEPDAHRLGKRLTFLRDHLGWRNAGMLRVAADAELSRQHFVLQHEGETLSVLRLPGTHLEVFAAPLGVESFAEVLPKRSVRVGQAGCVEVRRGNERVLRLHVFLGEAVLAQCSSLVSTTDSSGHTTRGATKAPKSKFELDEAEAEAIAEAVPRVYAAKSVKAGVHAEFPEWHREGLQRIMGYLDKSRPDMYWWRLMEHNRGGVLEEALRLVLADHPHASAIWKWLG